VGWNAGHRRIFVQAGMEPGSAIKSRRESADSGGFDLRKKLKKLQSSSANIR
jgi:hypothetical protein